jgi:small subunit ribosomal protein S17
MAGPSPDGGAEELSPGQDALAPGAPSAAATAGPVQAAPPAKQAAPPAKQVASPAAAAGPASPARQSRPASAPAVEPRSGRRKVREGIVASNAMDNTAVVLVVERVRHARYAKTVQRTKRLYAHDEANDVKVGDRVRLSETRPLSKLKRWRVEQVLERAR